MENLPAKNQKSSEGLIISDVVKLNNELLQLSCTNSALVQEITTLRSQRDLLVAEVLHLKEELETPENQHASLQGDQLMEEQEEDPVLLLVVDECTDAQLDIPAEKQAVVVSEEKYLNQQMKLCKSEENKEGVSEKIDDSERQLRRALDSQENEVTSVNSNFLQEMGFMKEEIKSCHAKISTTEAERDKITNEYELEIEKMKGMYNNAKEVIRSLEKDQISLQTQLKVTSEELEGIKCQHSIHFRNSTNTQDDVQILEQSNFELRKELVQTQESLRLSQSQIEELQTDNSEMKVENKSLSAQLEVANNQIRRMSNEAKFDDYHPSHQKLTLSSSISCPALNSLRELCDSDLKERSKGLKPRGKPFFIKKDSTKNTTPKTVVYENVGEDSLNHSMVAESFNNKSALGGSHFQCVNEKEFPDHCTLSKLEIEQPSSFAISAPSCCLNKFKNCYSWCPPHMQSSYPVETQMVPSEKYSVEGRIQCGDPPKPSLEKTKHEWWRKHRLAKRKHVDSNSSIYQQHPKKPVNAEEKNSTLQSNSEKKQPSVRMMYTEEMARTPTSVVRFLAKRQKMLLSQKAKEGL